MGEVGLLVRVVPDAPREVEVPVHAPRSDVAPRGDDAVVLAGELGLVVLAELEELPAALGHDAPGVPRVGDVQLGPLDEGGDGRAPDVERVERRGLEAVRTPVDGLEAREALGVEEAVVGGDVGLDKGGLDRVVARKVDVLERLDELLGEHLGTVLGYLGTTVPVKYAEKCARRIPVEP